VNDSTLGLTPDPRLETDESIDQIIAAALATFGEHGFANTTLDQIAVRARVSTPALLNFFPTKEDVFRDVVRSTLIGSLSARTDATVQAQEPSAADAVRTFARRYWTTMERPELVAIVRLVIGEMPRFPELAVFYATETLEQFVRALERIIDWGVARGELHPVDPRAAARTIVATLAAHALWFAHPEIYAGITGSDRERTVETTIETLIRALNPTETPTP
jgi:TetR/AcrR family transcriptional regulator